MYPRKTPATMDKFNDLLRGKHKKSAVNLLLLASLLFLPFTRFLLESLLSSYWTVQDVFHISLRDSNRLAIAPYIVLKLYVKIFSAKTKTSHEAYSHDINNPL